MSAKISEQMRNSSENKRSIMKTIITIALPIHELIGGAIKVRASGTYRWESNAIALMSEKEKMDIRIKFLLLTN